MHPARPARARGSGDRKRRPFTPVRQAGDDGQAGLTLDIFLARHGETEWSLAGRHTGTTDLPLTQHGEEHAEALGARLSVLRFDAVYSSPLQRALRTAELAGFDRVQVTPLLREVDYGQYEGLTSDQIHQTNPSWELFRDGCPGGETPAQIFARAEQFIDVATAHRTAGRVIAFAHGHILRAVAIAWIGGAIALARGLQLDSATLNILRDGDRGRLIALWNAD